MAFPRSQRFAEKETWPLSLPLNTSGAPPPTTYYLPSSFDENNCSAWGKPCAFDHQCSQCLSYDKSYDPNTQSNKPSDQVPSCTKQRSYAKSCGVNTKENICYVQKKDASNSSRLRKVLNPKVTEPKAPSFMTRPRQSIHNCFANSADETQKDFTLSTSHFNRYSLSRHSLKRKSVKMDKENKLKSHKNVEDALSSPFRVKIIPNLQDNRQLNVSYIIRNKNTEILDNKSEEYDIPNKSTTSPVTIANRLNNITDDMKESENLDANVSEGNTVFTNYQPNSNLEVGSSIQKILENDDSLPKEFLYNFDDTKLTNDDSNNLEKVPLNPIVPPETFLEKTENEVKIDEEETETESMLNNGTDNVEKTLQSHHLSPDIENHVVFLIADEFIDDEYDSYVNNFTLEIQDKRHRDSTAADLFQIYKSLIHMSIRKQNVNAPKRKVVRKVKQQSGFKRGVKAKQTAKMLQRRTRTGNHANILWSEIVRAAITDLKGEFKNEIYKETKEKVHAIMSNLAKVLLKAEDSIDKSCERTTVALINKLEEIVTN